MPSACTLSWRIRICKGIHLKDAALPVYSKEASEASAASRQKFLSVLSFLDSKKLNEEERYTYDLLCDRLALDLEESDFSYYEEPFPRPPACRASCFYYLQNIRFIPLTTWKPIFPSCSPFPITCRVCFLMNPKKVQPGFYGKRGRQKSAQQCREILTKEALSSGTHFLQTTFSSRLASLFTKRTSDRQAAVTIRSPKPVAFVKIRPARLAVARRRAGTAFRHRTHEGEDFPRSPTGGNIMPGSSRNPPVPPFPWISSICSFKNSFRKPTKR